MPQSWDAGRRRDIRACDFKVLTVKQRYPQSLYPAGYQLICPTISFSVYLPRPVKIQEMLEMVNASHHFGKSTATYFIRSEWVFFFRRQLIALVPNCRGAM